MKKVLLLFLFLSSLSFSAQEHELTGRVVDKKTGAPVAGAHVVSMGVYSAETDYDGSFTLTSMVPLKSIKVTAPGMNYEKKKARNGMTVKMKPQTMWNTKPEKWSPFLSLQYMVPTDDEFSMGIMAGVIKKHGFYVKGMYSPSKSSERGDWDDFFTFTGKHSYSVSSIGGGYMCRLLAPLNMYVGAGYMDKKLSFENVDGSYVRYDRGDYDYERPSNYHSESGLYTELGFMGVFNHVIVNVGCMMDITHDFDFCPQTPVHVHVGVGYQF